MASETFHPSDSDLVRFADRELSKAEAAPIEAYLETSDASQKLVAALSDYGNEAPSPDPLTGADPLAVGPEELEEALQAVLASQPERVGVVDVAQPPDPSPIPWPTAIESSRPEVPRSSRPWVPMLSAALVLIACGWALSERTSRLQQANSPEALANVPVLTLQGWDDPLRNPTLVTSPVDQGAVLSLVGRDPLPLDTYRVRILREDETTALEVLGLKPWPAGHLSLFVPPRALVPGTYQVVLESSDGTQWPQRFLLRVSP